MESERFDRFARALGAALPRRVALGGLLGGGFGLLAAGSESRQRNGKRDRGRRRTGVGSQAATCANPGPDANLSGCNFSNRDFAGRDLSSSVMRGTRFRGTNLCGADLSSSQLRNADFRGFADPGKATILYRADLSSSGCTGAQFNARTLFCRTKTCSGAISDRDCPPDADLADVCCTDADCGGNRGCTAGRCAAPCDVCAAGCRFSSVQAAIDAADPGDTISICPGTYKEVVRPTKDVNLAGRGAAPSDTVLTNDSADGLFYISAGATVTVENLSFTGQGSIERAWLANSGALTLRRVRVTGMTSNSDATFYNWSEMTVIDSLFQGNTTVDGGGGGLFNQENAVLTLVRTRIEGNRGERGGGIYNEGRLTLTDNSVVTGNTATRPAPTGGGVFNRGTVSVDATSRITGNTPDDCVDNTFEEMSGSGCPA